VISHLELDVRNGVEDRSGLGVQLPSCAIASTFDTLSIAGRQVFSKNSAADFESANAEVLAANTKAPETAKMVIMRMKN
jgi:hypothetical protein